ncbi:Ubiquitin domain-containing protein 2 [Mortierella sp. AD032]|nr:Ubiquitin domain-containing protein 2 [Mortierella sp. AD032]
MGCCSSLPVDNDSQPGYGGRRILSLKTHKWNAPAPPPTRIQLEREREEFWDTAPVYDGRPQVWQALRAACACGDDPEEEDPDQIQVILDAARITVPSEVAPELTAAATGNTAALEEAGGAGGGSDWSSRWRRTRHQRLDPMAQLACYDHLGNLYVIPIKMLANPGNLVEDCGRGGEGSSAGTNISAGAVSAESRGKAVARHDAAGEEVSSLIEQEVVRIRVSNIQKEVSLLVAGTRTTIGQIKARLREDGVVASEKTSSVRVLFLGRVLEDSERLQDIAHFQEGAEGTVLQVLVSSV